MPIYKKTTMIVFSAIVGVIFGLAIAFNFSFTQNGFAENKAKGNLSVSMNAAPETLTLNSDLESTSKAFVEIAKRVTPTVVSITSEKVVKVPDQFSTFFHGDDFFRRFLPKGERNREYKQRGLGSGVIVSANGYILTNYHVVKDADEIDVVIDKKPYDAEIIGTDPATDIAVVKIGEENLPAIRLGDSEKLEVGEWVLAIGSPFELSLQHTVTSGIISAKGRSLNLSGDLTYQDFIQTDAAINPGNSGGALVNIHGELIGINTAIYAGNAGGNVGIGFAVPISLAKQVMDDLIEHGEVVRGYLGVRIGSLDPDLSAALNIEDNEGAIIEEVVAGTPADKAGLRKSDVIVGVGTRKIVDAQSLTNLIASFNPGETVRLKIMRDGREKNISVRLEKRPGDPNEVRPAKARSESATGKFGLHLHDLTAELADRYGYSEFDGVLVVEVAPNSVAAQKDVRVGDLITEVDRQPIKSLRQLEKISDSLAAGKIVLFQIRRGQSNHFVAMKVPE